MPPPLLAAREIPARQRSGGRAGKWLTVLALICVVGVGTIVVANRGGRLSTSATTITAGSVSLGGITTDVGATTSDPTVDDNKNFLSGKLEQSPRPASHEVVSPAAANAESSSSALDYSVTNFYHERDGKPGAQIPWLKNVKLAEPHRDTTMKVSSPRTGCQYTWVVQTMDDDGNKEVLATAEGPEVVVQFTRLDTNSVLLREIDEATGETLREAKDTVMVKYVRREIRTLTDDEREELLDAVRIFVGLVFALLQ